ncbi:MAG: type II secretion system protein GspG [Candidatus Hydrogenedentota bacterium]|nr:MAG: type II secretion system protein GspG [Candidatus Hydrogenedentota bacterium]
MTHRQSHVKTTRVINRGNAGGFSLIELMVVIAIIAMLAGAVGFAMFGALDDASVSKAKAEISTFKTALTAYRITFKRLPSTNDGLNSLVHNEKRNFLDLSEIPMDPWGNPYTYTLESDGGFTIVSYGADGSQGGDGINADISSKNLNK